MYDAVNDEWIQLSDRELNLIQRIRHGQFPHPEMNPYPDYIPYFTSMCCVTLSSRTDDTQH